MTQAGGSATINGVLYQILGSIDWAVRIRLSATVESDDFSKALLILEPAGGGGDVVIKWDTGRIVEQWKAKSDHKTWSLAKVIDTVIPDLYLSVSVNHLDAKSEYRFITEGRRGNWERAEEFFKSLNPPIPDDPLESLDDNDEISSFKRERLVGDKKKSVTCKFTRRTLFKEIADKVRERKAISEESETTTYQKLWHLLARFELKKPLAKEELEKRINAFLYGVVDYCEQIDGKRRELCGFIMQQVAKGEMKLSPKELLKGAGLNARSLEDWLTIKKELDRSLEYAFENIARYIPSEDVRKTPDWPEGIDILLLSGESGQGKTWQLAKLASDMRMPAVFIEAKGDAEKTLEDASRIIWKDVAGHDNLITLDRIVSRREEIHKTLNNRTSWLLLCIDDIQSIREARELIRKDWEGWVIRLTMTVPPTIGQILKKEASEKVHLIEVQDFTFEELRRYLQCRNRKWEIVPPDVRSTLFRPFLAKLYCDLPESPEWVPINEYQLYEKYWKRIDIAREQADFPNDASLLIRLVRTIFEETYPWTSGQIEDVGLNNEARKRLESIGWLKRLDNNYAGIWHDRLLNWAVAESLITERREKAITCEELGNKLAGLLGEKTTYAGKYLGYVLMDVLWIASDARNPLSNEVHKYLSIIDSSSKIPSTKFYRDSLPTLGDRIIPAIIQRVRTSKTKTEHSWFLRDALIEIGKKSPDAVKKSALQLLDDPLSELKQAAAGVLSKYPCADALEKLWRLHKHNVKLRENKNNRYAFWLYQDTSAALNACIQLDSSWLVEKIHNVRSDEPVWELAYKLGLVDPSATNIWLEVRDELFEKVPEHKARCLIHCVRHFKDTEKITWVESCLEVTEDEDKDFIRASALAVLALFEPQKTLRYLEKKLLSMWELPMTRGWWLPELLIRVPGETRQYLRNLMIKFPDKFWDIAHIYKNYENEMDVETLNLLLERLEQRLSDIRQNADLSETGSTPFLNILNFFSKISRYELLSCFESKANSVLERELVEIAYLRVGKEERYLKDIKLILLKIGGCGLTKVINTELTHTDPDVRISGIGWSSVQPDSKTFLNLKKIIQSDVLWDMNDNSTFPLEQLYATTNLACLGDIETMIDAILKWGNDVASIHLSQIITKQFLRSKTLLADLNQCLESDDSDQRGKAILILGYGKRTEFAKRIRELFQEASPDSKLAFYCLIAMYELKDEDERTVKCIKKQLYPYETEYGRLAGETLLEIGTPEAIKVIKEYIEYSINNINQPSIPENALDLAVNLAKRFPAEIMFSAQIIWKKIKELPQEDLKPIWFECIGYLEDAEVSYWLWDRISSTKSQERAIFAIRGSAKFDPDVAFEAAQQLLKDSLNSKALIPELLVELDVKRAIPILCEHIAYERENLCHQSIGRALRNSEYTDFILEHVESLCKSSSSIEIQAGVELCGWQEGNFIEDMLNGYALNDPDAEVRKTAIEALKRYRQRQGTRKLIDILKSAKGCQRWSILEAILQQEDPYLLTNEKDPLCLFKVLENMPFRFSIYAQEKIDERIKEIKKKAEEIDAKLK